MGPPPLPKNEFGIWIGSGSRLSLLAMFRAGDGLHDIGREIRSSGADSLCLDCVGLSAPRIGPPRRDGLSVPLRSIPTAEPMGAWTAVAPIARAARARQGALPKGLLVAVHHLGPLLLRPKEITPPAGG